MKRKTLSDRALNDVLKIAVMPKIKEEYWEKLTKVIMKRIKKMEASSRDYSA